MGAFSSIRIPASQVVAEQASSGKRNTHGPVDKSLDFKGAGNV